MRFVWLLLFVSLNTSVLAQPPEVAETVREQNQRRKNQHRQWRSGSRWMVGAWAGVYASPRTHRNTWSGSETVRAFYGGGLMVVAGRYIRHWLRFDAQVSAASIGRTELSDRVHGIETSAGVALSIHGASFPRAGLGLGIDVVRAREANATDDGRITWWGARFRWIHELMFFTRRGNAAGIQITPTWTWVPYEQKFKPGVLMGLNVQFGGW